MGCHHHYHVRGKIQITPLSDLNPSFGRLFFVAKMDAHVQYTTFPNLYSTEDCIHQPATLRLEWPQHLSQRALLLAWAALLQAYTGLSDPVFTLDARPIQVDVALGSWTVVEVGSSHDIHYRQTSVALNKVGVHLSQLGAVPSDSFLAFSSAYVCTRAALRPYLGPDNSVFSQLYSRALPPTDIRPIAAPGC